VCSGEKLELRSNAIELCYAIVFPHFINPYLQTTMLFMLLTAINLSLHPDQDSRADLHPDWVPSLFLLIPPVYVVYCKSTTCSQEI